MLRLENPAAIRRAGQFFQDSGYTSKNIHGDLGFTELPWRKLRNRHLLRYKARERVPLHVLLRLFYVGDSIPLEQLQGIIPPDVLSAMTDSGLLELTNGIAAGACFVLPFGEEWVVASDQITHMEDQDLPDIVSQANSTTMILENFAVRRPARAALDLGTGCGALALLLSRFSDSVLATDINARAIFFTKFNAFLNGVSNIECQVSDAFAAAAGRKFDRILANPPFYVGPVHHFVFCDSPLELDGFCRKLAKEAPQYLEEGGFFQMLCEWVEIAGQPWTDHLTEWFEGSGCDVLVLKYHHMTPSQYAHDRLFEANPLHPEKDEDVFAERLRFYESHGVHRICGGAVAMRRRSGENWIRMEDFLNIPKVPFGEAVLDRFATQDVGMNLTDEDIANARPKLSPHTRLRQEWQQNNAEWSLVNQELGITQGFAAMLRVDPMVAQTIAQFNGGQTIRELAAAIAASVNGNPAMVQTEVTRLVRKMLRNGFVTL